MFDPIEFLVLGKARPAGSKRALPVKLKSGETKTIVVDANKHSKPWKQQVAQTARCMYHGPLLDEPVALALIFVVPRPKSHFRTGKNSHLLRESAPDRPTVKPDLLKLARGVEDALTGIIYRDDALIVDEHLAKVYGEPEATIVRITPASEESAAIIS